MTTTLLPLSGITFHGSLTLRIVFEPSLNGTCWASERSRLWPSPLPSVTTTIRLASSPYAPDKVIDDASADNTVVPTSVPLFDSHMICSPLFWSTVNTNATPARTAVACSASSTSNPSAVFCWTNAPALTVSSGPAPLGT